MKNFLICLFVFISFSLSAQLNPKHIFVNSESDVLSQVELSSFSQYPQITVLPGSGSDSLTVDFSSANTYLLNFLPTSGFSGDTKIVVEYYEPGPFPGIPFPNYTIIHFRFKESVVKTTPDYILATQDSIGINVLANDDNSHGDLTLDRIGYVEGGTASITDSTISFQFDSGADNAFIRYFASDTLDNVESNIVYLTKEDSELIRTHNISVDNKSLIRLTCPSDDFEIETSASNGSVFLGEADHIWYYSSNSSFVGLDTISFSTVDGGSLTYSVNVLNKAIDNQLVVDDQYFVEIDGTISFNVFENDYRDDRNIVDYSSDLNYLADGTFTYSPPQGFNGDKVFFYKVFTGLAIQTAQIVIHVDDFAPTAEVEYEFDILKDHVLKVTHDNDLNSYSYSSSVDPAYGSVTILEANGSEVLPCATISGENTIIYTPDPGFSGIDEFDLEYCTIQGNCEIVKIDVQVLDSNFDDCLCLNNCVYSGDTNDDGVVDMKDILDMALNLGEGGYDRSNDFPLFWTGQESDDWGYQQMNDGIDLKCGDADGDGYIDYNDFSEVYNNYGQLHKLVNEEHAITSEVPIYFIPPSNPVDSGEWISLDIAIGNNAYPAIDFYGSAFTLNINPDIIDSSSVIFTLYDDNWLSYESPLESMYSVPKDGQVDIGVSRISNVSTDGVGIIGKLEFIVEDEVVGFKRSSLSNSSMISMNNIISTNEYGEYHAHPIYEDAITFNEGDRLDENELNISINVSPNPTSGLLTIESEKYSIDNIELIDALGRVLHESQYSNTRSHSIDITSFNQGTYFVRITSNGKTTVKKIQKID